MKMSASNELSSDNSRESSRQIIQNGSMRIQVSSIKKSMLYLNNRVQQLNGYVVQATMSSQLNQQQATSAYALVRVPATHFSSLLLAMSQHATKVINKQVYRQDITSRFVDLKSRLKNQEAALTQYKRIMQQAKSATDVLKVYKEVSRVQGQIDQLKGQIKYYQQAVSMSQLRVQMSSTPPIKKPASHPWAIGQTISNAFVALVTGFKKVVQFTIRFVIYYLPFLVLGVLAISLLFFLGRALIRRIKK